MTPDPRVGERKGAYWEDVGRDWSERGRDQLWRRCSDLIHTHWLDRAGQDVRGQLVLKTDLFDEAFGDGLAGWFESRGNRVVACDIAASTARSANRRKRKTAIIVADVRRLPLTSGAFDCVVSDSTLDHFDSEDGIRQSLAELARLLKPGGLLLLTLDNPGHPLVLLRNWLPRFWIRLGIVPYHVGATCTPGRLRLLLSQAGFEPAEVRGLMHVPRVLMVPLCAWLQARRDMAEPTGALSRWLIRFERLADLPTGLITGHFIAAVARKK